MSKGIVAGNVVDVINKTIYPGIVTFDGGKIIQIEKTNHEYNHFVLPGFVDAHIHIESSMLTPWEFARMASVHGTVATVSDPHEIANVCGIEGVKYMIADAKGAAVKIFFGAPSCVPATSFENTGAHISVSEIRELFENGLTKYLSEMMNYPGVLQKDPVVMEKIMLAHEFGFPVDGHAPGLKGEDAVKYISAGISTDHECFELDEASGKANAGMHIIIREGSAARNFDSLYSLINTHPDLCMFCSDDKHPDELFKGHINELVKRAIAKGCNLFDVLRVASYNPVIHYNLDVGLLRTQDPADFIIVDNLGDLNVLQTYVNGVQVAQNGTSTVPERKPETINNFSAAKITQDYLLVPHSGNEINVIEAIDGQLITNLIRCEAKSFGNNIISDVENDILKIVVVNRYQNKKPAVGFVKNFGLKKGAIASSVAHDSHNIICVGTDDESMTLAINLIIANQGGLSVVNNSGKYVLPLPIAGLMSERPCTDVSLLYTELDQQVKTMGSKLRAPFMTLSFMALLVIPSYKISDMGLFDGNLFQFKGLYD